MLVLVELYGLDIYRVIWPYDALLSVCFGVELPHLFRVFWTYFSFVLYIVYIYTYTHTT